jgi:hypothetical protein
MDIDLTPIDGRNVDVPYFLEFAAGELKKHISLVKNKDYKKIAFTSSNKNNFKKFFEEIVPLMFFLQREKGIYGKIKYMSGDQEGDAILDDSTTIEITKAQNENRYLVTQDLINHGYAFSPKNIQNHVSTTSPTKTQPYVHRNKEHVDDVALYIHKAIEKKQEKDYPHNSILIILLESDTSMVEFDGDYYCLEEKIMNFKKGIFSKIYIIENFFIVDSQPKWQFIL